MAYVCFNCGKGNTISTRSQHHKGVAGGQWKHKAQKSRKMFRANLHKIRLNVDGTVRRIKLCTDCISKFHTVSQLRAGKNTLSRLNFAKQPITAK